MTLRLFRCPSCDHKLRYGAKTCGKCFAPASSINHRWLGVLGAIGGIIVLGVLALA